MKQPRLWHIAGLFELALLLWGKYDQMFSVDSACFWSWREITGVHTELYILVSLSVECPRNL